MIMSVKGNSKTNKKQHRLKKRTAIIFVLILDAVFVIGLVAFYLWSKNRMDLVYSEVYVEIGEDAPDVSEFLKREEENVSFSGDSSFDMGAVGDYGLTILWDSPLLGTRSFDTILHVVDTTPPEVVPVTSVTYFDYDKDEKEPMSLLESVTDYTECSVRFSEDYDFTKKGEFDVSIVVSDTSGNETEVSVPCTILHDDTPPKISGVKPIEVHMGDVISYTEGIEVSDDYDESPGLEVDTSNVNTDKKGTYKVVYTATDAAGNTASEETTIKLLPKELKDITEEDVYALADDVIKEIINDGMSQKEKASAIYNWVVASITYSYATGYDNMLSGAYVGLTAFRGDCTVMQKTAEVLLKRVGIKTMEIEKIRDEHGGHSWLLIDIGEGWYHYDPTRMDDGTLIFYWSDAKLMDFEKTDFMTHHNYDASKYPAIQ